MKFFNKPFTALLLGVLSLLVLTACGSSAESGSDVTAPPAETESVQPETFRPSTLGVPPQPGFDMPVMGLSITLPQELQEAIAGQSIFMDAHEEPSADGTAIGYAYVSWNTMTEEQRDAEVDFSPEAFQTWLSGLTRVGSIGIFAADRVGDLDALTGSTDHKLLGESEDGSYQYYLSTNAAAPEADRAMVAAVGHSLYAMGALGDSAFGPVKPAAGNLGSFTMEDLNGNTYTQELFAENELTMVNLFATWCSPCVREIPELEELNNTMKDQGVGVIGIVLDAVDNNGQRSDSGIQKALKLAEKTGAAYPFLIPDATMMNGRLIGVTAVPETFFVDSEGNIVGDTYPGARDLKGWTEIVELELARLKEGQ